MAGRSPSVSREASPERHMDVRVTDHARAIVHALQHRLFEKCFAVIFAIYAVLATTKDANAGNRVYLSSFWMFAAKGGLVLVAVRLLRYLEKSDVPRSHGDFMTALSCVAGVYFAFTSASRYFYSAIGWALVLAVLAHYRK
jgi:drug/metabolite transporter superfamily protein YnfA